MNEDIITSSIELNSFKVFATVYDVNEKDLNKPFASRRPFVLNEAVETEKSIHFDIFRDKTIISSPSFTVPLYARVIPRIEDSTTDLTDKQRIIEALQKYIDVFNR